LLSPAIRTTFLHPTPHHKPKPISNPTQTPKSESKSTPVHLHRRVLGPPLEQHRRPHSAVTLLRPLHRGPARPARRRRRRRRRLVERGGERRQGGRERGGGGGGGGGGSSGGWERGSSGRRAAVQGAAVPRDAGGFRGERAGARAGVHLCFEALRLGGELFLLCAGEAAVGGKEAGRD
jgi:hypothetical protein